MGDHPAKDPPSDLAQIVMGPESIMPSKRLMAMGLLSKYPAKSSIVQKVMIRGLNKPNYTKYEIAHMVAVYFMPGLPRHWLLYQFERLGSENPMACYKTVQRIAYKHRDKYIHLAHENVLFMGHDEIERFYLRRNPRTKASHPSWAIGYFGDMVKKGMKLREIAEKLNLPMNSVKYALYDRSMFTDNTRNPNPVDFGTWKQRK